MSSKKSRGRLWVDPGFQFRLLSRVGLYMVAYALVIVHVAFVFEVMWALLSPRTVEWNTAFYLQFLYQYRFFLCGVVLVLPSILYDMLKFSHRVAGPLYRCRQTMLEMAEGKPVPEFKPRKHDLMPELFQAFNALIQQYNARTPTEMEGRPSDAPAHSLVSKEPCAASAAGLHTSI
jgi:hypothetical protein